MPAVQLSAEQYAALACTSLGLVVSIVLAPKTTFFLGNVAFFWLPQVVVLSIVLVFSRSAPVMAGAAFALALYLAAFGTWIHTKSHLGGNEWAGYILSLPGACIAAVVAAAVVRHYPHLSPLATGAVATAATLSGVAINQAIVYKTAMQ